MKTSVLENNLLLYILSLEVFIVPNYLRYRVPYFWWFENVVACSLAETAGGGGGSEFQGQW
jgi:hypothetical protein